MTWVVIGTRERRYRVETLGEVAAWVDDEVDAMRAGWLPLSSQIEADGGLRVLYGQLPPDAHESQDPPVPDDVGADSERPILHTPAGVGWGMGVLLTMAVFMLAIVMLLKP
jgi:hypothetical protein